MFKTTFVVTPIADTNLVTVAITPKSFLALTAKSFFWAVAPTALLVGGLVLWDEMTEKKSTNTEDHFPHPVD